MPLSEETVYEALRQVQDPEFLVSIVDLGLIYEVTVTEEGGKTHVFVKMTMTTPACPFGPQMVQETVEALEALEEVDQAKVEVTLSPPWTPDRMTEEARDELGMF